MSVINIDETNGNENKVESGTNEGKTQVFFVLDESGSMNSVLDATIGGFNEYVQILSKKTDNVCISLLKFNSETGVNDVFLEKHISDVPKLSNENYKPNALTPLYDAIGTTMSRAEKIVNNDDNVLIIIQTDGQENMSKEYTFDTVKALIKNKQENNWTIVFLGADMDAWGSIGNSLGLSRGNTLSYNSGDTKGMFATIAANTTSFSATNTSTKNFFKK